jgi:hypothetical protein
MPFLTQPLEADPIMLLLLISLLGKDMQLGREFLMNYLSSITM